MGITKIIDLSTGVNAQILNLSRNYWKLDLLINIVAVCFLIPVNYFLIKNYGTIGCAFGNFILISVFNIVKTITIYRYIKIHPYSKANLYLLFFILVNLVIVCLFFYDNGGANLNSKFEIVLKVAFKSIIFIAIFTYSLYLTKIAEEFNTTVQKMITKINNFIKIYSH